MAKLTNIQIVNRILRNIGEAQVTDLTALTNIQLVVFDKLNRVIYELGQDRHYIPLEAKGTITLNTATNEYAIATDCQEEDRESFRSVDNIDNIEFKTTQEWDALYPAGIGTSTKGYPTKVTKYMANFIFNSYPGTAENAKLINYRYWQIATVLTTTGITGTTCWMPEGFDETLLVAWVTYEVMQYKGSPEANKYYIDVWGDAQRRKEGSLAKFRRLYTSPILKARIVYPF